MVLSDSQLLSLLIAYRRTWCPGGSILNVGLLVPAQPPRAWLRGTSLDQHMGALGGIWKTRSSAD